MHENEYDASGDTFLVVTIKEDADIIRSGDDIENWAIYDCLNNYYQYDYVNEEELRKKILNSACFMYEDDFEDEFGVTPSSCSIYELINLLKVTLGADEHLVAVIDVNIEHLLYRSEPDRTKELEFFLNYDNDSFVEFLLSHEPNEILEDMLLTDGASYDICKNLDDAFSKGTNHIPNSGVTQNGKESVLDDLKAAAETCLDYRSNHTVSFGDLQEFAENPSAFIREFPSYFNDYPYVDIRASCCGIDPLLIYFLYEESVSSFLANCHSGDDVGRKCSNLYDGQSYDDSASPVEYFYTLHYIEIPEDKLDELGTLNDEEPDLFN